MLLFCVMYLSSFMLVIGCDSWFLVWLGLEINMISFIVMIYGKSVMNVESCMKYFFIQGIGSGMLMGSFYFDYSFINFLAGMILSYKIGGGPFFFWFPSLCEGVGWVSCGVLMTLQKILPLLMLSFFISNVIWVMLFFSLLFGVLGSFNEVKIKKLLAFSSIHHIGWLMLCLMLGLKVWVMYFFIYCLLIVSVLWIFYSQECLNINDMCLHKVGLIIVSMLNMGGVPPMLGFFLKWWIFSLMLNFSMWVLSGLVVLSVIMFYIYLRISFSILLGYFNNSFFMKNHQFLNLFSLEGWIIGGMILTPFLGFLFL